MHAVKMQSAFVYYVKKKNNGFDFLIYSLNKSIPQLGTKHVDMNPVL